MARYLRFYLLSTEWTDKPVELSGTSSISTDISPSGFKYEEEKVASNKYYYSTAWLSSTNDEIATISISYSTSVKSHKLTKYNTSLMSGEEYDYSSYGITQTIDGSTVTYSGTFKQWYNFGYALNSSTSAVAGVNCSVEFGDAVAKYTVNVTTQNCTCNTEIKSEYEHGEIISLEFSTGSDEYGFKFPNTDCYFNSDGLTNASYSVSDDMQTVTLTGEIIGDLNVSVVPHKIHRVRITGTLENCTCNYSDGEEITDEKQYIRIESNYTNYIDPFTLENYPKVVYFCDDPYKHYEKVTDGRLENIEQDIENYSYQYIFDNFSTYEENGVTYYVRQEGGESGYDNAYILNHYVYKVDNETYNFTNVGGEDIDNSSNEASLVTELVSKQIIVDPLLPDEQANTSDWILPDNYKAVEHVYYSWKAKYPDDSELYPMHSRVFIDDNSPYPNYTCNYISGEYRKDSKPCLLLVANNGYKFYRSPDVFGNPLLYYSCSADPYPVAYSEDETKLFIFLELGNNKGDATIVNIKTVKVDDSGGTGGGDSGGTGGDDSGGTGGDDSGGTGGDDSGGTGGDDSGGTGGDDSGGTGTGKIHITGTLENCTCNYSNGEYLSTGKPVIIILANNNCTFKSSYYYKEGSTVKTFNVSNDKTYLYVNISDFNIDITLDDYYWVVENPVEKIGSFANIYKPTETELRSLSSVRFMDDVDMGQYITALFNIPFKIPSNIITGGKQSIKLGKYDSTVKSYGLTTYKITVDMGEISIPEKYGNIYDYIDTECILNLPYFDKIYLNNEFVIGQTLRIEYVIDLYSGNTTANIYSSFTNGVIECVTGTIACNIPFIQKDTNSVINLISNINKNNIDTANIIITRNKPYNVETVFGSETVDFGVIGNYNGFIKVSNVVLNSSATNEEKEEIINLLKEGVTIYEN